MTKNEYKRDFWIGLATFLFSVSYIVLAQTQIGDETDGYDNITGRTFPYMVGGVLLVVGIISMISNHMRSLSAISIKKTTIDIERVRRVCVYSLAIALYTIFISYVGYIVSTFAAIVFAMWFSGAKLNVASVLVSIILPPSLYYVFHILMQIPLPRALLL